MRKFYSASISRTLISFEISMIISRNNIRKLKAKQYQFMNSGITKNLRLSRIKSESLAGMTVALALIPESLAFAAIAKVSPMVALYTSFCMAVVIAIVGGRPAMISAATGSMALLMTTLVANHGVEYLFAATILTGIIQFLIGIFKLGKYFSFIPQSVISGFVNALGILIFTAQLQQFQGESWQMYGMVAVTLAIVYLLPRLTKSMAGGDEVLFAGIDEAPMTRGLLILAQMSSQGNFMNKEYTQACVEAAREHKDFVMGFVSQESLNSEPEDQFIHMTPGCQLPPEDEDQNGTVQGDGKGQQYNTPQKIIGVCGADIAIVGRGILRAGDPEEEAERYRSAAWKAYTERVR